MNIGLHFCPIGSDSESVFEYVASERNNSSDEDSDDFFVVPIPDCFIATLPARLDASTSVVVSKADAPSLAGQCFQRVTAL